MEVEERLKQQAELIAALQKKVEQSRTWVPPNWLLNAAEPITGQVSMPWFDGEHLNWAPATIVGQKPTFADNQQIVFASDGAQAAPKPN